MAQYHRLSLVEREVLSRLLAAGASLRAIGQALSRAPSTLSRELTRHQASPVTYRAVTAHQRAQHWAHQPHETIGVLLCGSFSHAHRWMTYKTRSEHNLS
jgi:IS30 family transposase